MVSCPNCGAQISAEYKFCRFCGIKIRPQSSTKASTTGDPSRYYEGTIPGVFDSTPVQFSGFAKWMPDEIPRMSPSELIVMLQEIKAMVTRREAKIYQAVNLRQECMRLTANLQQSRRKPIIFMILAICFAVLFLFWLLVSVIAYDDGVEAFVFLTCVPCFIAFSILAILFAVAKCGQKTALRTYEENYPRFKQAFDRTVADVNQDIYMHGNDYISAIVALPSYWNNHMALEYFLDAALNHRALTLGDAINLYEKHQVDQRLQGIMYQQLATQRATAAAVNEAAYNTKIAAMASVLTAKSARISAISNTVSAVANVITANHTK